MRAFIPLLFVAGCSSVSLECENTAPILIPPQEQLSGVTMDQIVKFNTLGGKACGSDWWSQRW